MKIKLHSLLMEEDSQIYFIICTLVNFYHNSFILQPSFQNCGCIHLFYYLLLVGKVFFYFYILYIFVIILMSIINKCVCDWRTVHYSTSLSFSLSLLGLFFFAGVLLLLLFQPLFHNNNNNHDNKRRTMSR